MTLRGPAGWQTAMADLTLILFLVVAAAYREDAPERVDPADSQAQAADISLGQPMAVFRPGGDADLARWLAAQHMGVQPHEMLICSTGVIGVELPMSLIDSGIKQIQPSRDGGHALARAMMTTDTRPKETAVSFQVGGRQALMGGVSKGSGMIHPNMATMLAFITTDAPFDRRILAALDESTLRLDLKYRMGADHALIWWRCEGRGRVFYSALGHKAEAWADPAHLRMVDGAIGWAARREGAGGAIE